MEKLRTYLSEQNLTSRAFAAQIDVDPSLVSRWLAGTTLPRPDRMWKIAQVTSGLVPMEAWVGAA